MKSMKSLAIACALAICATLSLQAGPAGCCEKAKKAGKTCEHQCCIDAAKDGKNCTKCKGSGDIKDNKKDEKKDEKKDDKK